MSSHRNWSFLITLLEQHHFMVQTHPENSFTVHAMSAVERSWIPAHESKAELVLELASDVLRPVDMHSLLVVLGIVES